MLGRRRKERPKAAVAGYSPFLSPFANDGFKLIVPLHQPFPVFSRDRNHQRVFLLSETLRNLLFHYHNLAFLRPYGFGVVVKPYVGELRQCQNQQGYACKDNQPGIILYYPAYALHSKPLLLAAEKQAGLVILYQHYQGCHKQQGGNEARKYAYACNNPKLVKPFKVCGDYAEECGGRGKRTCDNTGGGAGKGGVKRLSYIPGFYKFALAPVEDMDYVVYAKAHKHGGDYAASKIETSEDEIGNAECPRQGGQQRCRCDYKDNKPLPVYKLKQEKNKYCGCRRVYEHILLHCYLGFNGIGIRTCKPYLQVIVPAEFLFCVFNYMVDFCLEPFYKHDVPA